MVKVGVWGSWDGSIGTHDLEIPKVFSLYSL
jgi:hypothetical protein